MSFVVPMPESKFQDKIKEVSIITYSTDDDLEHVSNAYRLVVSPPFKISDAASMLNEYGMVLLGADIVEDTCRVWLKETDINKCQRNHVLFLWFSPARTNMHEVEIQEALEKIRKLTGLRGKKIGGSQ